MKFQSIEQLREATLRADGPIQISHAEYERLSAQSEAQRLMTAARRLADGETRWEVLRGPMGSHQLPDLLDLAWPALPHHELVEAVSDALTMCDVPEKHLPRRKWLPIFTPPAITSITTPMFPHQIA